MIWPFKRKRKVPAELPSSSDYELGPVLSQHVRLTEQFHELHFSQRDELNTVSEQLVQISAEAARAIQNQKPYNGMPHNVGFDHMVRVLVQEREFDHAINLCRKASKERWAGDWKGEIKDIKDAKAKHLAKVTGRN